jgi:hypothetical protein
MKNLELFEQKYCFVESFDSVRYTKLLDEKRYEELPDTDKKTKELQAEVELIYAILLGHKIVVPEAHSFDSVGFLEIITEALDARPKEKEKSEKSWISKPFILSKRADYPNYLSMVSKRLGQESFILSALSEINNNIDLRKYISNCILQGNFQDISQRIQKEIPQQSWDYCEEKINKIRKMNDYFSEPNKSIEAINLFGRLEEYVNNIISLNNIPEVLQKEEGFSKLRDGVIKLKEAEIKFADRSTVRNRGKEYLDIEEYLGVVEYVDSCYNAVIYQATGANNGILTTTETTRGRYVLLAQRLSEESANLGTKDRIEEAFNNSDAEAFKRHLETWSGKREDRWQSIWEIMLSDRWVDSVNNLIQANDGTKRNAYKAHIKELRQLAREYISDIAVEETEEFSQSVHAVADRENLLTLKLSIEESEQANKLDELKDITDIDGSTPGSDY